MRRLVLAVLLAISGAIVAPSLTVRPWSPAGEGAVAHQERADAGPMHGPLRTWRVAALGQGLHGLARDSSAHALGSELHSQWRAARVNHVALQESRPGTPRPRLHYPLFPTGPPRVLASA